MVYMSELLIVGCGGLGRMVGEVALATGKWTFDGKTIVPFCTSGSSSIGSSADALEPLTQGATWLEGQRFSGSASQETVSQWVDALDLDLGQAA